MPEKRRHNDDFKIMNLLGNSGVDIATHEPLHSIQLIMILVHGQPLHPQNNLDFSSNTNALLFYNLFPIIYLDLSPLHSYSLLVLLGILVRSLYQSRVSLLHIAINKSCISPNS